MSDQTTPADCPNCNGEGAVRAMTYGHGPDDYEYDAECTACMGTGSAELADAINALPYQNHTVKPHTEMVSRAAVLEIIKARAAAQPAPAPSDAEEWLLQRFGVVRGHPEWRALTEAFNAGRTTQPAPAAVPAGYALVPVEPTDAMAQAGGAFCIFPRHVYGAMLDAAPAPATWGEHG